MMKYFQPTVKNKRQDGEDLCTGQPLLSNLPIFIVASDFRILNITGTSRSPPFSCQSLFPLLTSEVLHPELSVYQPLLSFTLNTNLCIINVTKYYFAGFELDVNSFLLYDSLCNLLFCSQHCLREVAMKRL